MTLQTKIQTLRATFIKFTNRKKSITALVSASLAFGLIFLVSAFYLRDLSSEYESITKRKTDRLLVVLAQVKQAAEETDSIENGHAIGIALLRKSFESHDVDFFVVRDADTHEVITSENVGDLTEGQHRTFDVLNSMQIYEHVVLGSIKVGSSSEMGSSSQIRSPSQVRTPPNAMNQPNSRIVSVGFNRSWPEFRKHALLSLIKNALIDIVLTLMLVGGLLLYFLKDIRSLLNRFEQKTRTPLKNIQPMSQESERLMKTLTGFENQVLQLKTAQTHFERQLFSATDRELKSGRTPPYEFSCALVRTDLNGFSEMRKRLPEPIFQAMVDDLFISSMELVERFGGLVTEYLGDELIYFFKEAECANHVQHAFACAWALNRLAEEKERKWRGQAHTELRFKSAIVTGELTVRSATRSFEFSGMPLIESVRLLKEVTERNEPIVVVSPEAAVKGGTELCATRFYKSADMKGIGIKSIARVSAPVTVEEILLRIQTKPDAVQDLNLHRTEGEVVAQMKWMRRRLSDEIEGSLDSSLQVCRTMVAATRLPFESDAVAEEIVAMLKLALHTKQYQALLAPLLTLAGEIVHPRSAHTNVYEVLSQLARHPESRVKANAIEAIARLGLPLSDTKPATVEHNRVLANYVLAKGMLDVTGEVARGVTEMMKSADPFFRASALFALGEIGAHHLQRDQVYVYSNSYLTELFQIAMSLLEDESEMVRRQTLRLSAKVHIEPIQKAVESYRDRTKNKADIPRLLEIEHNYDKFLGETATQVVAHLKRAV